MPQLKYKLTTFLVPIYITIEESFSTFKANHSFIPNAEWTIVEHPRFGLIRGLKALENIEQVTKIFLALINFMLNIIKQCH